MIVIHCRFRIPARHREAWIESGKRMAIASRAEPGCLGYAFSFDIIDPEIAYAYEKWENEQYLHDHEKTEHRLRRREEIRAMNLGYEEIRFFDVDPADERDMLSVAPRPGEKD